MKWSIVEVPCGNKHQHVPTAALETSPGEVRAVVSEGASSSPHLEQLEGSGPEEPEDSSAQGGYAKKVDTC